ncbi:hypothetical protein HMPREF1210_00118 [Paenisporosarcina sp. HGH0030]|uniref:hypothetical protein n=1 Tax=Paenisporosarcina sp. HGH0030 TaxID=1078085 RepID=UPI00034E43EF|nr:hypothetical protein [Paenisporosarcina sp. HGH0030]EPD54133.1 hypothetical protein HMPREF1210_00118 [Paenisporosarcina sp. HGH0030]
MLWNYRVLKKQISEKEVVFDICEVYYKDGEPNGWVWDENILKQESLEDLKDALIGIQEALKQPVLEIIGDDEGLREI